MSQLRVNLHMVDAAHAPCSPCWVHLWGSMPALWLMGSCAVLFKHVTCMAVNVRGTKLSPWKGTPTYQPQSPKGP